MKSIDIVGSAVSSQILFGKPSGMFTTGAYIGLLSCTINGVSSIISENSINVWVLADQTAYTMLATTYIPTSAIIPYVLGSGGAFYVLGTPKIVVTSFQYDTTSHKLQMAKRDDFGLFYGTTTGWLDVDQAEAC